METTLKAVIRAALLKDGFREFDRTDWYGLADAERFDNGAEPLIKETAVYLYIYDNSGLTRLHPETGEFDKLDMEFSTFPY